MVRRFPPACLVLLALAPARAAEPALVTVGPLPPGCAASGACIAALRPAKPKAAVRRARSVAGQERWRFEPLPPGRYALEVRRAADGWGCVAAAVEVAPGRNTLHVDWREPLPVHGLVVGADGVPRAGVDVRVAPPPPGAASGTHCGLEDSRAVTDESGRFRVLADRCCPITIAGPGAQVTIEPAQPEQTVVLPG